jgi:hypothetical protein
MLRHIHSFCCTVVPSGTESRYIFLTVCIGDNIRHVHANDPNPILEQYDAPLVGRLKETRTRFNKALWNNSLLYQMVHDGYGHVEQTVKHWFRPHYLQQIDQLTMSDFRGITPTSFSPKAIPAKDTDNDDDDLFFRDSAGWKITRTLIVKLKAEVEDAGGRLVLIHFPSEGLVLSGLPVPHERCRSIEWITE